MKVYFVRHGESTLTDKRHQLPDTPLGERGLKQASAVAHRFSDISIELILTSSHIRAVQTAKAIEKIANSSLIQSDLLIERKMPSVFYGKFTNDPEIVPIHQTIKENFYDPNWHYADEENFTDLLMRVKNAINFFHSQKKENIVVVTHGYFLTVMIFYILFGDNSNPLSFKSFREHTYHTNTGITVCEYKYDKWKLKTWNDYAHLGDN